MTLLNQIIADLKQDGKKEIPGADAFKLFDTYGFPVEMTNEYAQDEGLQVDMAGFKKNMAAQRDRARKARGDRQSMGSQDKVLMSITTPSKFTGWTELDHKHASLQTIVVNDQLQDSVSEGTAQLIFDETPFYAEMGGQVADHGEIKAQDGTVLADVSDVQHAPNGQNLHTVTVKGKLETGQQYWLSVDPLRRKKVSLNHTATHLLDQALRDVLGEHTHQAGSLVEPDYLRFDFTNFGQVTPKQLRQVETIVNQKIWDALPITWKEMPIEEAKKLGAIAMFGDKYGSVVRIVKIGDYNTEFDGGTHPTNSNALGLFKITSESGIGAGIRRVEAVTSKEAYEYLTQQQDWLSETAENLKIDQVKNVPSKVTQLQADLKAEQKTVAGLQAKLAAQAAAGIFDHPEEVGGLKLIAKQVQVAGMNELRQLADKWKAKQASDILVLGTEVSGKANLLVAVNDTANQAGFKAGDLIKAIAPKVGGGGGGRPDMAQAGGKNPAGIPAALSEAKTVISQKA